MDKYREWKLKIPEEGISFRAMCSHIEGRLYRLESMQIASEMIEYGDIFEGNEIGDTLQVQRLVEKSKRRNFYYILTRESRESEELKAVLTIVENYGGKWVQEFGGMLAINLPTDTEYDPTADLLKMVEGSSKQL